MTWGFVAAGAATVVTGYMQSQASRRAGAQQGRAAANGIAEQRRQSDLVNNMLAPYRQGGERAFGGQQDLLGLNGEQSQGAAINALSSSPQFSALIKQGEEGILQNASVTGGLRGGNTQGALAQFRPQMLSALIDQQYARLGGMAQMGQNSAALTANSSMNAANQISGLYGQAGAAQAGATLGSANAWGQTASGLAGIYGAYRGQNPQQQGFQRQGSGVYAMGPQADGFITNPQAGF